MSSKSDSELHRKMAAELFNSTWRLIAKKRRTKDEDDRMIHMAHASRYHWSVVGGTEGGGDRRVADLPRLRVAPSTGARAVPCPALPRGLRRRRDRRLSARLRVRGPREGLRDRREDPAPECMSETRE